MDTNPHIRLAEVEPRHQGVVIEPYRGPLLANGGERQLRRVALPRSNAAPLFAFDVPAPEWLAQYPEPAHHWFITRWLHRTFRDDNDEELNAAKRGFGWMLLMLCFFALETSTWLLLAGTDAPTHSAVFRAVVGGMALFSSLSPLFVAALLPSSLADAVYALRHKLDSQNPRLTFRLSLVTLIVDLIVLGAIVFILIEFAIAMNDIDFARL